MRSWIRLRSGLRTLFSHSRRQAELEDEIRFHLESAIERHRKRGLPEEEARRAARLEFGSVDAAKEGVRDAWVQARLAELAGDARLALRGHRRRPAYAATVIVTVALAIGAVGVIFNALWVVLFRPLPFAADRDLAVLRYAELDTRETLGLSPPELADFRAANRSLESLAEYHHMDFTLLGHGEPRRVRAGVVSPGYFRLLGVRPILGRDFVEDDNSPSARPVLLLSHRFWREELGGGAVVGADFTMNDKIHTVIGVLPPLPPAPDENDVFMPVSACPFRAGEHWAHSRTARGLEVIARLRRGRDLRAATSDLEVVTRRLAQSYPEAYPARLGLRPELVPLRDAMTANARPTLWLLGAAAATMLLLVAANLLNLTLAQLARRDAELAVRAALGAGGGRIARQLATEGCALALAGGALGFLLTFAGRGLLVRFLGRLTPRASEIRPDWTTAWIVLVLSLGIGLVIGLLPALKRASSLAAALRSGGPATTMGGGSTRTRDALVVLQVAGSFVLLIGAGLLLRSVWNLERVPAGYRHPDVLTLGLPVNWTKYSTDARRLAYAERLVARVRELPGVEAVALADNYPLSSNLPWNRRVAVGRAAPDPATPGPTADFRTVSPGYFETVGVPLLAGRPLRDDDRDPAHGVALVNQEFARQMFADRDPLGKAVIFGGGDTVWSIVGVVGDVHQRALGERATPEVYAPLAQRGGGVGVMLVRAGATRSLVPALRAAIRAVDPEQPITEVRTLAETHAEALAAPRATAALLALAAVLALVIAAAGLAGLLAYSLGQRQREFGIRQALGACRMDIARLVLVRTGGLVAAGALIGLGGALLATRGLGSMLYGLASSDLQTYAVVALVLGGAAFGACLPALRRAIGTAPGLALRAL